MSDQLITQVGGAAQADAARYAQANATTTAAEASQQEVVEQGKAVQPTEENTESDADEQAEVQDKASLPRQDKITDVFLKFQIDDQNELTIYVLDKSSGEVIRTIPAEEIARMSAGELVELFI